MHDFGVLVGTFYLPFHVLSSYVLVLCTLLQGEQTLGSSTVSNTPEATPPYLNSSSISSKRSRSQPPSCRRTIGSSLFLSRHPHHSSRHSLSRHAQSASNSSPVALLEGRHSFKLPGDSGDSTVGGGSIFAWAQRRRDASFLPGHQIVFYFNHYHIDSNCFDI